MKNMFEINHKQMPSPTMCSYKLADLSSEESGRSTYNGVMQKDVIARKHTLSCKWDRLSWKEASTLAQLCKFNGITVDVTFPDLAEGCFTTLKFYTGDFDADYDLWKDGEQWVANVSCDFVEV